MLFRSISSIGAFISILPFYFENTDAVMFRMYQHVFSPLEDKQIYTTKRKYPRQVEIGCIFSFQKGAVYSNMNEKPLFFS